MNPRIDFMKIALREAMSAKSKGDYAIGAVIVYGDAIVCRSENRVKRDESPVGHAEILAIAGAARILKRRHLTDCILYSTHEPCPMCATAAIFARLKGIVFGARWTDMQTYSLKHRNGIFLWRTVGMPCKEIIGKSDETIAVIPDFMREDCVALFHH